MPSRFIPPNLAAILLVFFLAGAFCVAEMCPKPLIVVFVGAVGAVGEWRSRSRLEVFGKGGSDGLAGRGGARAEAGCGGVTASA